MAVEVEGKEPTDRELTGLQQRARATGIAVIFVQPQVAAQGARAIAQSLGLRLETLDPTAADVAANLAQAVRGIATAYQHEAEAPR